MIIKNCNDCPFNAGVYEASFKEIDNAVYYCSLYGRHTNSAIEFTKNPEDEKKYDDYLFGEAGDWKPSFCKLQEVIIKEK